VTQSKSVRAGRERRAPMSAYRLIAAVRDGDPEPPFLASCGRIRVPSDRTTWRFASDVEAPKDRFRKLSLPVAVSGANAACGGTN
jgi:hypothetical protein